MIEQALFGFLSTQASVSALAGTRIYPDAIPQHHYEEATRLPCLVFNIVGSSRESDSCGALDRVTRLVQFDAYARDRKLANQLGEALVAALVDYTGEMNGTFVDRVSFVNEFYALDPEPGLFRRCIRLNVSHHL